MEAWYRVAAYLAKTLASKRGVERIDLLTLNKVMYFAQRESYIKNEEPLFEINQFHAAQFGPVIIGLKKRLNDGKLEEMPSDEWIVENKPLLDYVIAHYGSMSPNSLSTLSHNEISWRNAVEKAHQQRYHRIVDSDIRIDALKIRIRENKLQTNI